MKIKKTRYTQEFKEQAVKLSVMPETTVDQVARELGVSPGTLVGWRQKAGITVSRSGVSDSMKRELETLRQRNQQLERKKSYRNGARYIKKSRGLFREEPSVTYGFVCAEKTVFPVIIMCATLGVSSSGYYEWLGRPISKQARQDLALIAALRIQHVAHKQRYGSRRHQAELPVNIGRNRVRRLMKKAGLFARHKRRFVITTKSDNDNPADNLLDRDFYPPKPNHSWVGDITYIPTTEGWLYLATVIDLFSRRIIGWSISEHITKRLVLDAFRLAVGRRGCAPNCLFHSDRGSQYTSRDFTKILKAHGITSSMSRRANCWDNAVAESFFATLKKELSFEMVGKNRDQIRQELVSFIEGYYNRKRLHSSLGYKTPVKHEEDWSASQTVSNQPLWEMV